MDSPVATPASPLRPYAAGPSSVRLFWQIATFAGLVLAAHAAAFVPALPFLAVSSQLAEQVYITLCAIAMLVVSRIVCRKFEGSPLAATGIGFDRPWALHLIGGFVAGGALIGIAWFAFDRLGWQSFEAAEPRSQRWVGLLLAAAYCIATAVHEEVICRGYAFQILYRRSPAAALVLGGALFASIHLFSEGGTDLLALLNLFIAHFFFAATYLRTRSLWLPIGLHTGWNFVEAFVLGMPISGQVPALRVLTTHTERNLWTGYAFGPEGGLFVTLLFIAAAVVAWVALRQRRPAIDLLGESGGGATSMGGQPLLDLPTAPARRVLATDVLRGIAILGILPMNMQIFALYPTIVIYPYAGDYTDSTNIAVWTLLRVFIGSKDLFIFSMLFGAGILMVEGSRNTPAEGGAGLHYRRMGVLLLFGLIHAYLIWGGDILVTYAMLGSLLYWLRRLRPSWLATIGAAAFLFPMMLLLAAQLIVPNMRESWQTGIVDFLKPSGETIAEFNQIYGGGWVAQMAKRASDALSNQTVNVLICMGWVAGGMMLIGMAMQKNGLLTAKGSTRTYAMMVVAAVFVGLPLLIYSFVWNFAREWRLPDGFFLGWFFREFSYGIIAIGWVGAVMLLGRAGLLARWSLPLAAVGRMALTNYLLQSVICSLIFYGHGLGLVGKVDFMGLVWITLAIWVAQLITSPLWLARYRFGPAEWLWRSLSYGEWQPMRHANSPAVPALG